jgi:hypothetical protein
VNPINKEFYNHIRLIFICYNDLHANLLAVDCWSCRCKPNFLQVCSCVKKEAMMLIVS